MKKIALIGNSTLSKSFNNRYKESFFLETFYSTGIIDKTSCENLLANLYEYDTIVFTAGTILDPVWEMLTLNFTVPAFIVSNLLENNFKGHFIYVGSYGSLWTSWPGINLKRLTYNISKLAANKFMNAVTHSNIGDMSISVLNPSKFKSKMSNFEGMEVEQVAEILKFIIDSSGTIKITNLNLTK